MEDIKTVLSEKVRKILNNEGFDLIHFIIKGNKPSQVFQITVDHIRGVSVDDCAKLSRRLSDMLDQNDMHLNLGSYRLEVSSPGIDTPIKTEKDFIKNLNRNVTISYYRDDILTAIEGIISDVKQDSVIIQGKRNSWQILFSDIKQAKVKINWSQQRKIQ